jgi:anti-sigma B factor antagonist
MKIRTQDYNGVAVMELQGELGSDSIGLFQNTVADIIAAHKVGVVLDMSNVRFIDSAGLEQLLRVQDYCNENNCQLKLAGLDENLTRILEVTRLEKKFERYAELAEAVKSFA